MVQQAIEKANLTEKDLSAVAVTIGPGLSLCLRGEIKKCTLEPTFEKVDFLQFEGIINGQFIFSPKFGMQWVCRKLGRSPDCFICLLLEYIIWKLMLWLLGFH